MRAKPQIGININDDAQAFTAQILSGSKTIETRKTPSLRPYIGKTVGIIRTGKKAQATLVGFAKIDSEVFFSTKQEFDEAQALHLVAPESAHYGDGVKFGYKLTNIKRVRPRPIKTLGIVSRKLN